MPQSLVKMLAHIVFSTKDRQPFINPGIEAQLFGYISGIITNNNARLIIAGGMRDHIHLLVSIGRMDISELIGDIKRDSSRWMKKQGVVDFYWQRGYGAFSRRRSPLATGTPFTFLYRFGKTNSRSPASNGAETFYFEVRRYYEETVVFDVCRVRFRGGSVWAG